MVVFRCNFIEWRDKKIVYKRYASLFFVACVDKDDNELIALEMIHLFVEVLDRYFGNVCELDIIFNFHKVTTAAKINNPARVARKSQGCVTDVSSPSAVGDRDTHTEF